MNSFFKNKLKLLDASFERWLNKKTPQPEPQKVKMQILDSYRGSLKVFIETGTYEGATVEALKDRFKKIISIELDSVRYQKAVDRFSSDPNITIIQGDSGTVLASLLDTLEEPALFWLDGHYSGIGTAKGVEHTPILKELETILRHKISEHVILIDDARYFIGENGYPTISKLLSYITSLRNVHLDIQNDIIRITPGRTHSTTTSYHVPVRQKMARLYHLIKKWFRVILY